MTDISLRMHHINAIADEKSKQARGLPYSEAVITAAEIYLRLNPVPAAHDFLTLSQPPGG